MANNPIRVTCPGCNTGVKLTNPALVGRSITCPACGRLFVARADAAVQQAPRPARRPRHEDEEPQRKSGGGFLLALVVVLLGIILGGGGVGALILYLKTRPTDTPMAVNPDKGKPIDNGDGSRGIGGGAGTRHALLVGVTEYANSAFSTLKYTENDIEELANALDGFDSVRVLTVTRGQRDKAAAPTATNVKKSLDSLLVGRKKGDTVLVAMAGHGITLELKDPDGKGESRTYPYFCAADADLADPRYSDGDSQTMVNLDELFSKLGRCGASSKLVLMDACRNELAVKAGRRSFEAPSVNIPQGVAAFYSAGKGQFAYETNKLGTKGGHGIFFHHVIQGLKGEAKDRRGRVTWSSLVDHATEKVAEDVPTLIGGGAKQTPAAMGNLEGESPVLVAAAQPVPSKDGAKPQTDSGKGAVVAEDGEKAKGKEPVKTTPGKAGETIENSLGMKLVQIPAGSFQMGSPADEKDRVSNEHPHKVEITKPFYMGVYEVRQVDYRKLMKENPSRFKLGGQFEGWVKSIDTDPFPVDSVSWDDAVKFCEELSKQKEEKVAGRVYRLPTEAEWEYACRAGSTTAFHTGEELKVTHANFNTILNRPAEVGKIGKPNAWGLYDLHGNVSEWCSDWYGEHYYKDGPNQSKDPQGPEEGTLRVARGGNWSIAGPSCRSAHRWMEVPTGLSERVGFRVVCEIKK